MRRKDPGLCSRWPTTNVGLAGQRGASSARRIQSAGCGTRRRRHNSPMTEAASRLALSRKTVTAVFADMVGSTPMAERLDPEPLREVLERYFESMRLIIQRHGGTVDKFIGDAVVATFGVPQMNEDDALRAVRAAWEMQRALATLNQDLEPRLGVTLMQRIGVNTGDVVAGD